MLNAAKGMQMSYEDTLHWPRAALKKHLQGTYPLNKQVSEEKKNMLPLKNRALASSACIT